MQESLENIHLLSETSNFRTNLLRLPVWLDESQAACESNMEQELHWASVSYTEKELISFLWRQRETTRLKSVKQRLGETAWYSLFLIYKKMGNLHDYLFYCFKTPKAFQEEGAVEMCITTVHHDLKLQLVSVICSRGIIANHLIIYFI